MHLYVLCGCDCYEATKLVECALEILLSILGFRDQKDLK